MRHGPQPQQAVAAVSISTLSADAHQFSAPELVVQAQLESHLGQRGAAGRGSEDRVLARQVRATESGSNSR